jgi:hypothetical protein
MQMKIVLAAALMAGSSVVAPAPADAAAAESPASLPQLREGEVLLEADGLAVVHTPATSATLSTTVSGRGATEAAARSSLDAEIRRVREAARGAGAAAADVSAGPAIRYQADTLFNFDPPSTADSAAEARPAYVFRSTIVIRLREASRALELNGAIGGDMAGLSAPVYEIADHAGPRREARRQAIAVARADAEALAEAVGMRIVRTLRVTERAGLDFAGMMLTEQNATAWSASGLQGPPAWKVGPWSTRSRSSASITCSRRASPRAGPAQRSPLRFLRASPAEAAGPCESSQAVAAVFITAFMPSQPSAEPLRLAMARAPQTPAAVATAAAPTAPPSMAAVRAWPRGSSPGPLILFSSGEKPKRFQCRRRGEVACRAVLEAGNHVIGARDVESARLLDVQVLDHAVVHDR